MSTQRSSARRRRSEIEDDEDADVVRRTQQSTPSSDTSKRARTNRYNRGSPSESENESPEPEETSTGNRRRTVNGVSQNGEVGGSEDGDITGSSKFQAGAIVRVKLLNFITYTKAEFFPGPNLNMVIGPNGTGKSSLVCAICLGLGWDPKHLGRASQINEFVKHNEKYAIVEVELQGRVNETKNHTVRLKIIRDGNGREWFYNGKKTSLKAIQALTKGLSIQIDNLCQFLPQDKVSEFAALSPVELLIQTQRAAAPEQMLEWHEALKKYRKDQKETEGRLERDQEQLHSLETRQESLRVEVQRLEERNQIQKRVEVLRKTVPFVEYRIAREDHMRHKADKKDAQIRLRNLRRQVEPTLQLANHKEDYVRQINAVVRERNNALHTAESAADNALRTIEDLVTSIQAKDKEIDAERDAGRKKKVEHSKLERNLVALRARASGPEPEFNGASYNEKIRAKESESRKIKEETVELQIQNKALEERGRANRDETIRAQQQLGEFDSQQGQQMNKLASFSKDTATAWKWVQEHMEEFEQEVYGPPVITCSIKDPKYTAVVETQLGRKDVLCLTAQTQNDWTKLTDQLLGKMRLFDIVIRRVSSSLADLNRPPLSSQDLNRFGLDGWALNYIDGPEPVLAMLCGSKKMHATAVTLREITDEQHNMVVNSACSAWVTPNSSNRVNRRSEYGPGATSTVTMTVRPPGFWTDAPVDTSARREIESKIESLTQSTAELKEQVLPIRAKIVENRTRIADITDEVQAIKDEKAVNQKAHGEWAALPAKIARDEEAIEKKKFEIHSLQQRVRDLCNQRDEAIADKAAQSLKHKAIVEKIRRCHEEYIDASVRLIEGQSDVEALKDRNRDIVTRLEEEELLVQEAERGTLAAHERATRAMEVVREITAEAEAAGEMAHFKGLPNDLTVDSVRNEMEAEANKLSYIHAGNPNAIRDFERRQADVDVIKEKVNAAREKLEKFARSIMKVRGKWEPELEKLIAQISEAFSYNFEQIGCAGEVGIHKDEDFDQWAIQIKVKFRENETLQILDQHRQSGGERSVSTIFYLMSLQALARAPFRVVDEINQGMDPRNERMVHERMVEIACKEHTSQYFLITPKLLTNLRYDKRMKVHCIASGEHMPADHTKMEVQKILALRRAIVAVG